MCEIVGYENEKREIEELKKMLLNSESYVERGVRIPRGILICGEPGVGKTILAKSAAADGICIVEPEISEGSDDEICDAIKDVFENAKKHSPAVVLLDEVERIAGMISPFAMHDSEKIKKMIASEMDALKDDDGVAVIAVGSDSMMLGEALIRPGRFDRTINLKLPDEATRAQILEHYFAKLRVKKDFDIGMAVYQTRGFTGAKLECLVNECGIVALSKDIPVVTDDDIRIVVNRLEFGASEGDPLADKEGLHAVAIHEAGHSMIAMLLFPDSFYNASIIMQGNSNGHICFVSNKNFKFNSDIEREVMVMLAGHVAERVILNDYACGSSCDINNVLCRLSSALFRSFLIISDMPRLCIDFLCRCVILLLANCHISALTDTPYLCIILFSYCRAFQR